MAVLTPARNESMCRPVLSGRLRKPSWIGPVFDKEGERERETDRDRQTDRQRQRERLTEGTQ